MHRKEVLTKLQLFGLLLVCGGMLVCGKVKVVHLPDEIKVEKNVAKETVVRNLTEEAELFKTHPFFLIDGFIYMFKRKPAELIKFTNDGKIVGRVGREGQGPGEFGSVWAISKYNGNLALLDSKRLKLIIYSKNLEYLNEFKLPKMYMGFWVDRKNRFVFYSEANSMADFYFSVYKENFQFLNAFGETRASPFSGDVRKYLGNLDSVENHVIIPEEDGIWCSFKNRYNLRYYLNEKLTIEIKAHENYFKRKEEIVRGITYVSYNDRSLQLCRHKNILYHFFRLDKNRYCDLFDLRTHLLLRRIQFEKKYSRMVHSSEKTFYGLAYQLEESGEDKDIVLVKIVL